MRGDDHPVIPFQLVCVDRGSACVLMHADQDTPYKDSRTMTLVRKAQGASMHSTVVSQEVRKASSDWCSCACDSPQGRPPVPCVEVPQATPRGPATRVTSRKPP